MDAARFEELADAYGGAIARWPQAEREAGLAFQAAQPAMAATVLADAQALDLVLDSWRVAAPSEALAARMLAGAPRRRPAWSYPSFWILGRGKGAAFGAGLAAACAAGAVVGSVWFGAVQTDTPSTAVASTPTVFNWSPGDISGQESAS